MAELESQGILSRNEVANFLREFADELDGETNDTRQERHDIEVSDEDSVGRERITLIVGGESATVTVPDVIEFEIEVESRSPLFGSGVNQGIEFELSWEIENPDELDEEWLDIQ